MITATATSLTAERALKLLGDGLPPHTVAASIGVTEAYISQLLSQEEFSAAVAERRYESLAAHNERDSKYDQMEDDLLKRMQDCIPLMHRPMELLKAIQVINMAKRRGQSTPESLIEKQSVVQLTIPIQIINQFKVNAQGQVLTVGEQSLLTIQSGNMDALRKKGNDLALIEGAPCAERSN